jgi:hypothetical protein
MVSPAATVLPVPTVRSLYVSDGTLDTGVKFGSMVFCVEELVDEDELELELELELFA